MKGERGSVEGRREGSREGGDVWKDGGKGEGGKGRKREGREGKREEEGGEGEKEGRKEWVWKRFTQDVYWTSTHLTC